MVDNPFHFGGVVRGAQFADRQQELDTLEREMLNLGRVFLISPRRYGKTCLLFNLTERLQRLNVPTVYIDLNAFPDLGGLVAAFASRAANALESNRDKLVRTLSQLKRLRPKLSVGQEGSISAGVEIAPQETDAMAALLEGMRYAQNLAYQKGLKLVVVIDEFSDLPKYDGQRLEKALRSEIQQHTHLGYVMSGSEQSVMMAMVQDRRRAFYRLGRILQLGPIPRDVYQAFILGWFEKEGYRITGQLIAPIFDMAQDVPYTIQRLCANVWEMARATKQVTQEMIRGLPRRIVRQDAPFYELLWQSATQIQKTLLMALSQDPNQRPFSKAFMLRHRLGPPSSIRASLNSLVKKGLLFRSVDGQYCFTDALMPVWINTLQE